MLTKSKHKHILSVHTGLTVNVFTLCSSHQISFQIMLFDLRHPVVLPEIAENEINSMSNTSTFINRSRLHVSTLIGSSSGLLFKTSL